MSPIHPGMRHTQKSQPLCRLWHTILTLGHHSHILSPKSCQRYKTLLRLSWWCIDPAPTKKTDFSQSRFSMRRSRKTWKPNHQPNYATIPTTRWWQKGPHHARPQGLSQRRKGAKIHKVLELQSPGLYSMIQRQCLKTESSVLRKGTSPSCSKVQDLGQLNGGQYPKVQVA